MRIYIALKRIHVWAWNSLTQQSCIYLGDSLSWFLWYLGELEYRVATNGNASATAPRTIKFPFRSGVKLSQCPFSRDCPRKNVAAAVFHHTVRLRENNFYGMSKTYFNAFNESEFYCITFRFYCPRPRWNPLSHWTTATTGKDEA